LWQSFPFPQSVSVGKRNSVRGHHPPIVRREWKILPPIETFCIFFLLYLQIRS
jgi:hypothetical protein